ncbi:MAG TPA: hypothetical protein VGK89_06995 [Candidatus Eisenbacteria bacterium]
MLVQAVGFATFVGADEGDAAKARKKERDREVVREERRRREGEEEGRRRKVEEARKRIERDARQVDREGYEHRLRTIVEMLEARENPERASGEDPQSISERLKREYLRMSRGERTGWSEAVGEGGMMVEARMRGYVPILAPTECSARPQGVDGVFWDPSTKQYVIVEAKGGYSSAATVEGTLKMAYGEKQGTLLWAEKALKATRESQTANSHEREVTDLLLNRLDQGRARVEVLWTRAREGEIGKTEVYREVRADGSSAFTEQARVPPKEKWN